MGISLLGGSVGQLGVGSFTRDFERWMKVGSGNEASLSVGALRRELGGGVPLMGILKVMQRMALETGISLHRGPTGEPRRVLI